MSSKRINNVLDKKRIRMRELFYNTRTARYFKDWPLSSFFISRRAYDEMHEYYALRDMVISVQCLVDKHQLSDENYVSFVLDLFHQHQESLSNPRECERPDIGGHYAAMHWLADHKHEDWWEDIFLPEYKAFALEVFESDLSECQKNQLQQT